MLAYARENLDQIGAAMQAGFEQAGLSARYWVLDASPHGVEIDVGM